MTQLNVGVVGLGAIGQKHCEVLAQIREAKLLAVADTNAELLNKTAGKFGALPFTDYEQMLQTPGLDAVVVATPDHLHRDFAIKAAQAGKHILVEKPIATTEEDALAIIAAADAAGVKLMVGFTLRFIPHYIQARSAVASGKLGTLISIFSRRLNVITQAERIEASTSIPRKFPQENEAFTIIHFENGVVACAHIGWNLPKLHPAGRDFKLDISGDKGSLNMDLERQGLEIFTETESKFPSTAPGLIEEDRAFVDCVLDDKPVPVSGHDGLVALNMVSAALKSIETGLPVKL